MPTDDEKREMQQLYGRLAKHWGWPLPDTWLADRETIVSNIGEALVCLRALVAEQCPQEAT